LTSPAGVFLLPKTLFNKEVNMHTKTCPQGHEIRSSADRDADGWCKKCRAFRQRQREALQLLKGLEAMTPQELAAALAADTPEG
jgi:hypothetical protein